MVSALARRLLHCLAEGLLPATEVQALAAAAWEDGCSWARYLHTHTYMAVGTQRLVASDRFSELPFERFRV